jgi:transposase
VIPGDVRIFVCTEPVDMRRGFDGLALAARERLGRDPLQGGLFVFVSKRANRLKILWLDGRGYAILYKRLHGARFRCSRASRCRHGAGANPRWVIKHEIYIDRQSSEV